MTNGARFHPGDSVQRSEVATVLTQEEWGRGLVLSAVKKNGIWSYRVDWPDRGEQSMLEIDDTIEPWVEPPTKSEMHAIRRRLQELERELS